MRLNIIQKKVIEAKPFENNVIKGKSNSGKTESLLHRMLYLVNNFAYEEEDRILFFHKNEEKLSEAKSRYANIAENNKYNYYSLLSSSLKPDFLSLSEIIQPLLEKIDIISLKRKEEIILDIIDNNDFKFCNKIKRENIKSIVSEIKFIKNNNINAREEYFELRGTPLKLRRNSNSRSDFFALYEKYNAKLIEERLIDEEGLILMALKKVESLNDKYVHIIVDNGEQLSKIELELLIALYKKKSYGTITIGVDIDKGENIYSSLVKKGRVYCKKVFGDKKKIFNFKSTIGEIKKDIITKVQVDKGEVYSYIDLKTGRRTKFQIEGPGEIICDDNVTFANNELIDVPVFNNIAAGEPILVTPEQEDVFSMPSFWLRGSNKKFILSVKGDSMINANINDGDKVIIEQNPSPMNGDIVAVNIDGNATLKRIKIGKDELFLLPENDKYKPIKVTKDDEFFIFGKAVGVIKK